MHMPCPICSAWQGSSPESGSFQYKITLNESFRHMTCINWMSEKGCACAELQRHELRICALLHPKQHTAGQVNCTGLPLNVSKSGSDIVHPWFLGGLRPCTLNSDRNAHAERVLQEEGRLMLLLDVGCQLGWDYSNWGLTAVSSSFCLVCSSNLPW